MALEEHIGGTLQRCYDLYKILAKLLQHGGL